VVEVVTSSSPISILRVRPSVRRPRESRSWLRGHNSAAEPGACGKPPKALYVENGGECLAGYRGATRLGLIPSRSDRQQTPQLLFTTTYPQVDNDPMARRLRRAPLVGRQTEISALDEALRLSADGSEGGPIAVVIAGDAGIGKSRLVAEVSTTAAAAGWQVLSAGCLDLSEGSVPYLPLVDALRALSSAELPPVLEHWRRGETEPAAPELSPDMARGRVYAAYLDLLRSRSDEGRAAHLSIRRTDPDLTSTRLARRAPPPTRRITARPGPSGSDGGNRPIGKPRHFRPTPSSGDLPALRRKPLLRRGTGSPMVSRRSTRARGCAQSCRRTGGPAGTARTQRGPSARRPWTPGRF
jgi:hypothetical protein